MLNILRENGVSVIICSYNGSKRMQPVLEALHRQVFDCLIPCEIIVVDNASTDDTGRIADGIWRSFPIGSEMPLRVVYELKPGLANARAKGIESASYDIVLFCDDDNWFDKNYLQGVYDILTSDPEIAACGGLGKPVFESEKPAWFDAYAEAYAVGSQRKTSERGRLISLYGAGMAINMHAMDTLKSSGFEPLMTGRTGKLLSSSEDTELTNAFVLAGYKLYFAPHLGFSHYLNKERLSFSYLHNLFSAFGKDGPIRNIYYAHITDRRLHQHIRSWYFHVLLATVRLMKYYIWPPKISGRRIYLNWNIAYLRRLFHLKKDYAMILANIKRISNARSRTGHFHISRVSATLNHN